jgi:glycerol uptake facilitator-like aquaporin
LIQGIFGSQYKQNIGLMKSVRLCMASALANPAITIARSLTDTFSSIQPADAPAFIFPQVIGEMVV